MSDQLHAGAAMIDITPPPGTHLAGSGAGEHRGVGGLGEYTVISEIFRSLV